MRRLRILTWHTNGSYLYYLSQAPHDFYVLSRPGRPRGYGGRTGPWPWGDNVHDLPTTEVRWKDFDCILFQDDNQYFVDQHALFRPAQHRLPRVYLEHDPPRDHPTDSPHPVDDRNVLVVHVTHFNALMWRHAHSETRVVEHGVVAPGNVNYTGEIARGIVAIDNPGRRGRRLGMDVLERAREEVALELVGVVDGGDPQGVGEISPDLLLPLAARYRFLFNPVRYTSLGLSVIEAMMVGMPIVGLATTEMATAIVNGESGYVDTNVARLIERMQELLRDPREAQRLGEGARRHANERFHIGRFVADWNSVFAAVTS